MGLFRKGKKVAIKQNHIFQIPRAGEEGILHRVKDLEALVVEFPDGERLEYGSDWVLPLESVGAKRKQRARDLLTELVVAGERLGLIALELDKEIENNLEWEEILYGQDELIARLEKIEKYF